MNDCRDVASINERVHSSYGSNCQSFFIERAYLTNIAPSQFSSSMEFPALMVSAPLTFHVMDVIALSPKEEMRRIDTESIIAFMANADAARDFAFENLPRDPMRELRFPLESDRSVSTAAANGSKPHMAAIRPVDIDLVHESFCGNLDIESAPWTPLFHVAHYSSTVRKNQ
jgi:hypothetical protein